MRLGARIGVIDQCEGITAVIACADLGEALICQHFGQHLEYERIVVKNEDIDLRGAVHDLFFYL